MYIFIDTCLNMEYISKYFSQFRYTSFYRYRYRFAYIERPREKEDREIDFK